MAIKITKMINTSNVLRTIWMNKGISRIEIAKELKLDKSTVTVIVSDLLKKRSIFEIEEGEAGPKGGRKPVKLMLNKSYGCIAGIEMHRGFYMAVLINLEGEILTSVYRKTVINKDNFFSHVKNIIKDLCTSDVSPPPLLGVGVGAGGIIDYHKGIILQSIPLDVEDFSISHELEKELDMPVTIENDANACCWGEMVFHRSTGLNNFLFVLAEFHGTVPQDSSTKCIGLGIGFVLNGKIHHGQHYSAGEFSSIDRKGGRQFAQEDARAAMVEYDEDAFKEFAEELSKHLAFLINTLNLDHIFLGGDVEKHKEKFTPILKEAIKSNWSYGDKQKPCSIHYSSFGKSAVAYGAAGMMLNKLFTNRELTKTFYH